MCGIVGLTDVNNFHLLSEMNDLLAYRGPDDKGIYQDESIFLAHHRLSIIDPSSGKQPMFDENKSLVLIYNGEIYNYKTLRQELINKGHRFRTNSDTEVLVYLYKEFGEKCLQKINGMFSFAIWDKEKRKLFCARDRLGIKPFYYSETDNAFFFASEIKALIQTGHISNKIHIPSFFNFLSFKYNPGPDTFFSNIKELKPGHFLILTATKKENVQYWNPPRQKNICDNKTEAIENVESLLRQSVKERLISDVPYGIFLSGGIDSSLILSYMQEFLGNNIKAFNVSFKESSHNELPYAKLAAKHFGAELINLTFTPREMMDTVLPVLSHFDQPFADEASIPTYLLSRETKKHVKMVLSGEGGDELFLGYVRYSTFKKNLLLKKYLRFLPDSVLKISNAFQHSNIEKLRVYAKALQNLKHPPYIMYYNWISSNIALNNVVHQNLKEELAHYSFEKHIKPFFSSSDPVIDSRYFDLSQYLPYDLLKKVDMTTMAFGLEARVPFLDHRLVEYVLQFPASWHASFFSQKKMLKQIASRRLPKAIWDRKKHGFLIPLGKWFRKEMKDILFDTLFQKDAKWIHYFNEQYIRSLLEKHVEQKGNYTQIIWMTFVFEQWLQGLEKHIDIQSS